jgi:hypothetical protein
VSKKTDTFDIQISGIGVSFFLLTLYRVSQKKKMKTIEIEVTNARKLLPRGQNFGLGCSKSGYNPWIIQN